MRPLLRRLLGAWTTETGVSAVPREVVRARLTIGRLWCLLAAVLIVAFGLLYRYSNPSAIDPLWARFLVAALPAGLVGLSYVSRWVQHHFADLVYALIYGLQAWFTGLAALNDFAPDYAIGLLFVFAALGVACSLGLEQRWPLPNFLSFAVLLSALALYVTDDLQVSRAIFLTCIATTALILYVALRVRRFVEEGLAESEEKNRAVLRQTSDGVFLVETETLRFIESNPAYRAFLGYTAEELHSRTLYAVAERSPELIEARVRRAREEGIHFIGESRHRRKDGTLVDLEVSANLISYAGREALCVVARDIRQRKRAHQALRAAKEHAEEMLRLKTALLNNMSHEIRTPLTGILGFAEVLIEEVEDEQQEFARLIAKNGKRLQDTLNSVMDLARLEGGEVELNIKPLDLNEEAQEAVRLLAPLAQQRGLYLCMEARQEPVQVALDQACLHRILHNLIGNAVKFTEAGGVTVEVEEGETQAILRVSDTGIGIKEAFLPHLFEEFKQASEGFGRSHEGVGLGLAITKRLVELMGGEIAVESQCGEGTTFSVYFPGIPEAK